MMVSIYDKTERKKGRFIAVISIDKWYYIFMLVGFLMMHANAIFEK